MRTASTECLQETTERIGNPENSFQHETPRALRRQRLHLVFSWITVGLLGGVEAVFGRTQYLGDWISYLNVSQAV